MKDVIQCFMSRIGNIKIDLLPNSRSLYAMFNESGHIERMKSNPQLGAVKLVYEGVHHTRWEYVVMQMLVAQTLKRENKKLGLSSTISIGNIDISGLDLLFCWALMLNAGHLIGTFASEKGLMYAIKRNKNIRDTFARSIGADVEIRKMFEDIIDDEWIYRVHELIAFCFMNRLKRKKNYDVKSFIDILKCYRIDQMKSIEKLERMRSLFKVVRLVSFLYLDTRYSPVPLQFDLGRILFDLSSYSDVLFGFSKNEMIMSLYNLETYMSDSVYMSAPVLSAYGAQSRCVGRDIVNRTFPSVSSLCSYLENSIEICCYDSDDYKSLRLIVDERKVKTQFVSGVKQIEIEAQMNENLPLSKCNVVLEKGPNNNILAVNYTFNINNSHEDYSRLIPKLIEQIYSLLIIPYCSVSGSVNECSAVFSSPYKELYFFSLESVSVNMVKFDVDKRIHQIDYYISTKGAVLAADTISRFSDYDYDKGFIDYSSYNERLALAAGIRGSGHRGIVLYSSCPVVVRNALDNKTITEIDGVAILSNKNSMKFCFVEAKHVRRGRYSKSIAQLEDSLNCIFGDYAQHIKVKKLNSYGAVAIVDLNSMFKQRLA